MTLIDAVYINDGGGKVILDLVIDYVLKNKNNKDLFLLIDERYTNNNLTKLKHLKLKASEISRIKFYLKNNFEKYFCLSNVPPPLKTSKDTYIYFHNALYFSDQGVNNSLQNKFLLRLKGFYIKFLNKNSYNWYTQNEITTEKLNFFLGNVGNLITVAPIFNTKYTPRIPVKREGFIYPCNSLPHKNINRLINSFIEAAKETNKTIILKLTIRESELSNFLNYPNNLKIFFLGEISHEEIINEYYKSEVLIYPSLVESFGLPIVESIYCGCKVIASNLPYVTSIVEANDYFDPSSVFEIKSCILKFLNYDDSFFPKLKVVNSLDDILNKLI